MKCLNLKDIEWTALQTPGTGAVERFNGILLNQLKTIYQINPFVKKQKRI
jgi:hypothetical protein